MRHQTIQQIHKYSATDYTCPKCHGHKKNPTAQLCYKCRDMKLRRSNESITGIPHLHILWQAVNKIRYPYKNRRNFYWFRDQALACLMLLVGCRISEALKVKRSQFDLSNPHWILLYNIKPGKHGDLRSEFKIPREGEWKPFADHLASWIMHVPSEDSYLFPTTRGHFDDSETKWSRPIDRTHAWRILSRGGKIPDSDGGFFNHYFRSVCFTKYGRVYGNSFMLAKKMGVSERTAAIYTHPEEDEVYDERIMKTR